MLRVDEDLADLDELINKLVDEIVQDEKMLNYQAAKADFESDDSLQKKLNRLSESQELVAYRSEFKAFEKELQQHPKVYALKLAENDLQALLSQISQKIAATVSPEIEVKSYHPLERRNHHAHRRS